MKKYLPYFFVVVILLTALFPSSSEAQRAALTPEESLWLRSRNETIVVYPEKNNPPFSYQDPSGAMTGLSIDYIELIAEKVGARLHYATPRPRAQVLEDLRDGKGDVALSIPSTREGEASFLFTESFLSVPVVIVVRKDRDVQKNVSMSNYNGRRIAVVEGSAAEAFIRENYPRVVLETMSDDEVGLQQAVLGEVDAAVMDVASLSYLLSKQVLSSVKIAGSLGLDYELSFAVPADKRVLQSILEKGLTQISAGERELLADKWIALPGARDARGGLAGLRNGWSVAEIIAAIVGGVGSIVLILSLHRKRFLRYRFKRDRTIDRLKDEMSELEAASDELSKELETVHRLEEDIQQKLKKLEE